ncbi:MAG: hypothetical protein JRG94_25420 [Deltaproteobacteria bacterium]|nr:hypothetical protein [Deltaproteobacteria bacterium]
MSVESGLGWIPFLLDFCEYQMDENAVTGLALRPKEYFARQIYASYWFEPDAQQSIERLPEDNVMFETDFPHPTCLYPGVQEQVQRTLGPFAEKLRTERGAWIFVELKARDRRCTLVQQGFATQRSAKRRAHRDGRGSSAAC